MSNGLTVAATACAGWVALVTAVLPMSGPATGLQNLIARVRKNKNKGPQNALDIANWLTGTTRFFLVVIPALAAFILGLIVLLRSH